MVDREHSFTGIGWQALLLVKRVEKARKSASNPSRELIFDLRNSLDNGLNVTVHRQGGITEGMEQAGGGNRAAGNLLFGSAPHQPVTNLADADAGFFNASDSVSKARK